jgi:hypothetical protein
MKQGSYYFFSARMLFHHALGVGVVVVVVVEMFSCLRR